MDNNEKIGELLDEVQASSATVVEVTHESEGAWVIACDSEDVFVSCEYIDTEDKLTLALSLGAPAESRRLQAYETMLMFNHLGVETGGVTMSLDGQGGQAVQNYAIDFSRLDVVTLQNVLENFVAKGVCWRQFLSEENAEQGEEGPSEGFPGDAIRV